jgi:uncharacterized protein YqhQ
VGHIINPAALLAFLFYIPMALARGGAADDFSVGGQAVIEGVMMRSRAWWSLAVRSPDGSIYSRCRPLNSILLRHPGLNKPFIRGIFNLGSMLALGFRALQESADVALAPEEPEAGTQESAAENGAEDGKGGRGFGWLEFSISMLLALGIFVGLFIALPTWLAPRIIGSDGNVVLQNLLEGLLRIAIFILYLLATSLMKDIRRLYQYHGAEHQSIHLFEDGLPLLPEEAASRGTDHVRCGTSFVLYALVLTVLIYSFLGKPDLWLRIIERLVLLPVIAGLAYEIIKLADRYRHNIFLRIIAAPGLALQKLTTRKPDQAEVAITSLRAVLDAEGKEYNDGLKT